MSNIFAEGAELLVSEGRPHGEFDQLVAGEPGLLVSRALDPFDPSMTVVAWPGRSFSSDPARGDIILRERPGANPSVAVVAEPRLLGRGEAIRESWIDDLSLPGQYVRTIEPSFAGLAPVRRIAGPDGLTLPGTIIVRAGGEANESDPAQRPTIRQGSSGPAVAEAQARLNAVNGSRVAQGQAPLPGCPLDVDGKFGPLTRQAVTAFQRTAFPGSPSEWDGVVGPKTWTALDDASGRLVPPVPPLPPFPPVPPNPPQPVTDASIQIVTGDIDFASLEGEVSVATSVMFGLWNQAYDNNGNIRNGAADADNFISLDARKFVIFVKDSGATGNEVTARWKTLKRTRADDDAPTVQTITLTRTSPNSKLFVSKPLMIVADKTDADQPTNSGLPATHPDAGIRNRGQSNHRLRHVEIDGFVKASYVSSRGNHVFTELPVFNRHPDARRKVRVGVINYGGHAQPSQITALVEQATLRWKQTGLAIQPSPAVTRPIPAGVLDGNGRYAGKSDNASEVAALADLIPATTDNTLTVVFVRLSNGSNAYTTVKERLRSNLGDRFFIFIDPDVDVENQTLGHEFHHALFNRFDTAATQPVIPDRPFFTFITFPGRAFGLPLPDVRVRRRIQFLHAADPNNDPSNNHIVNWIKRRRTTRTGIPAALDPPNASTGNKFVEPF
jgi:hypothetical protein